METQIIREAPEPLEFPAGVVALRDTLVMGEMLRLQEHLAQDLAVVAAVASAVCITTLMATYVWAVVPAAVGSACLGKALAAQA
jgi:hypothetical protein